MAGTVHGEEIALVMSVLILFRVSPTAGLERRGLLEGVLPPNFRLLFRVASNL